MLNAINLDSALSNASFNANSSFLNITARFSFFWWCDSAPQF